MKYLENSLLKIVLMLILSFFRLFMYAPYYCFKVLRVMQNKPILLFI